MLFFSIMYDIRLRVHKITKLLSHDEAEII